MEHISGKLSTGTDSTRCIVTEEMQKCGGISTFQGTYTATHIRMRIA